MKKLLSCLLIVLLLAGTALADTARVVNCKEWVSLRAYMSKDAERLAKVPLGETVSVLEYGNDFVYCEYRGQRGYILAEYLQDITHGGYSLNLKREYPLSGGETLTVRCLKDGSTRWTVEAECSLITELAGTAAWLTGSADNCRVWVYSAETGLVILDAKSGKCVAQAVIEELGHGVFAGGDEEGNAYVCGYYGPRAPMCISPEGRVLWRAETPSTEFYHPYAVDVREDGVIVYYSDPGVAVRYDSVTGQALDCEYDQSMSMD